MKKEITPIPNQEFVAEADEDLRPKGTTELREEITTKIYDTLTTRVSFILPEGTTLLKFSGQLADQILAYLKSQRVVRLIKIRMSRTGRHNFRKFNYLYEANFQAVEEL